MPSSILFMSSSDFGVGRDGSLLHNIQSGYSLVLFYSTQCPHCAAAQDIFKELNKTVIGCKFAMINIDNNKNIIQICKQSILPIEYVPLLVFFANGKAYMMYSGPLREQNIRQFIEQVATAYAEEYSSNDGQKTFIENFEGCGIDDQQCKEDYVKRQRGCYVTMKEAYSNK
jgi:thioredoxin-like negative regulator of GroEL